ncbi:MAG: hypothetical protein KBC84_09140 [Proteobacteria bacterium]|nr:hypothetical protein [Pseudomonadota bacterium]
MPILSFSFSKFIAFTFFLITVVTCFLLFIYKKDSQTFPRLDGGYYVGSISGISEQSDENYPLYIEKINGANILLMVIFAPSWKPQVVSLKANSLIDYNGGISQIASDYKALNISAKNTSFLLYGEKQSSSFSGEILSSKGKKGTWTVKPVSLESLKEDDKIKPTEFNLRAWLSAKTKYNLYKVEHDSLFTKNMQEEEKIQKLAKFVKEGDIIKDRSRLKREEIVTEINKVAEDRKEKTKNLNNAVSDITLLTKLDRHGQNVDIARRIARKEMAVLNASWSIEGNLANLEQQLAEQDNIDLQKLNNAYRRALEIEQLQQSIVDERNKIQAIQTKAAQPNEETVEQAEESQPSPEKQGELKGNLPPPEQKEKKWWEILE